MGNDVFSSQSRIDWDKNNVVTVCINVLPMRPDFLLPVYATQGAACFDLLIPDNLNLYPSAFSGGRAEVIGLGFAVEIPEGWEIQVRSRGGLAKQGVRVANAPGTVDWDYRGEFKVLLVNASGDVMKFRRGDAIAQGCIKYAPRVDFHVVEELGETPRGDGCLGSTGRTGDAFSQQVQLDLGFVVGGEA